MEKLFIIGWGLSGGFGGMRDYEVVEAKSLELAEELAWERACENYESYVGGNGLRELEEIMEEDEVDEEEAVEIFKEERESWVEYTAMEYTKENEAEVEGNHYDNPFKDS